jgi:hypothetical protein
MRLEFNPAEASQIDFGAGPTITDAHTGEVHKTDTVNLADFVDDDP